jgi:hypothetical protein
LKGEKVTKFFVTFFQDSEIPRFRDFISNYSVKQSKIKTSGYDGQFVLQWIHKQGLPPTIISRGLEILSMEFGGIRFLDSLNFLPMGLAAFPKALGFDAAKGYFPHLFNRRENWTCQQQGLPDRSYYGVNHMKPKAKADFDVWYTQHKDDFFDFRKELLYYCKVDVDILTQGCMRFRHLLKEVRLLDLLSVS